MPNIPDDLTEAPAPELLPPAVARTAYDAHCDDCEQCRTKPTCCAIGLELLTASMVQAHEIRW